MNGGWEWLQKNWIVICGMVVIGIWLGNLQAHVLSNTVSFQEIDRKISHVLCKMGEESECDRSRR